MLYSLQAEDLSEMRRVEVAKPKMLRVLLAVMRMDRIRHKYIGETKD